MVTHPADAVRSDAPFPLAGGILLGLGVGGFFDGIVLHQLLQWHHMVSSAGYPIDSLHNLEVNTIWDGVFHASTYVFVLAALVVIWRSIRQGTIRWSGPRIIGAVLIGFGLFNVVEGLVDHQILGLHHVNETAPREHWIYWDLGFLAWGAAMIAIGGVMAKRKASTPAIRPVGC
jgi:uncharacterized membrane protein